MLFPDDSAPNLDCYTIAPGEMRFDAGVLRRMANYLDEKAEAMTLRLAGDIPSAMKLEAKCERIYKSLPEWARW